jgi:hypothetical protein
MSNFNNLTNYNKISLKSESAAELVRELAKLGVFKQKRKSKTRAAKASDEIRPANDMGPGYVKTFPSQMLPNLPLIQQIDQGMTPQQIADIQERNNAAVAALRSEIEQNRFEQQQTISGLAGAAQREFGSLRSSLGEITNLKTERFRGAQEPGAGAYDPWRGPGGVMLLPDIQEGGVFTETLNPGAPELKPAIQTETFASEDGSEEEEGIQSDDFVQPEEPPPPRIGPRKPIKESAGTALRNRAAAEFGLGPVPDRDSSSSDTIKAYYEQLMNAAGEEPDSKLTSKKKRYKGIVDYLDSVVIPS